MDEKKKSKKQKLIVQISIITVIMFAATLVFTSVSDYLITRNSYLSSKNEMIDRDLKNYNLHLSDNRAYYIDHMKTDSENIIRPLTKEETELRQSDEVKSTQFELMMSKDKVDLDSLDEQNAYLYLKCTPDEPDLLTGVTDDYYTAVSYSECFKELTYDISKHSAVKEILSGKAFKDSETVYEVFNDDDGNNYYIGYIPVVVDGKTISYLAIQYDWSAFHSELLSYSRNQIIVGMVVLLALNVLLMLFIYLKAIRPLSKVEIGVQAYMEDNDSNTVSEKMSRIKVRNEIGRVADRFADLAKEIDRHTNEILKLNSEKEKIATEISTISSLSTTIILQW